MRFWWVNHKQTVKQEIAGGYLWSPQAEAGGKRSQFYENMRRAAPGDRVVSYADAQISHVGSVRDFAQVVPRPPEFRELGKQWNEIGWLLPVKWSALDKPVRPRDKLAELSPLLPHKYSPIHPVTGKGNQKAYLAEISSRAFQLLVPHETPDDELDPVQSQPLLAQVDDALQEAISTDPSLDATTKQQSILARYGQGKFRLQVIALHKCCLVTGVQSLGLLVASHIKPWRACADSRERLDGANGLLLAPHVDRLFDRGLLTFEGDGRIHISSKVPSGELLRLGLAEACSKTLARFPEATYKYLDFHRKNVFLV